MLRTEATLEEFSVCDSCGAELHVGENVMIIGDAIYCLKHDGEEDK